VAIPHGALSRLQQVGRGLETKGDRVTDVQVANPKPLCFDRFRLGNDIFRMAYEERLTLAATWIDRAVSDAGMALCLTS
jgi:hypothetical protein